MVGCLGPAPVGDERSGAHIGEEATCDPAQVGCWHEIDRAALAEISMRIDEAGGLPIEARGAVLCEVAQQIRGRLGHKLTPAQADGLAARQADSCMGGPRDEIALTGDAAELLAEPLLSLSLDAASAYTEVAELAPTGATADCPSCAGALRWPGWGWVPEEWPAGVRTALLAIASQTGPRGAVGRAYVAFVVMNGVWDTDFARENAQLFGELDVQTGAIRPSGLSESERADLISADADAKARWIGGISGALVSGGWLAATISGPLGVSVGAFGLAHRACRINLLRLRTALRMAAVYGFDPTEAHTVDLAMALSVNGGTWIHDGMGSAAETGVGFFTLMALLQYADPVMLATFGNATATAEVVVLTLGSLLSVGIGAGVGAAFEQLFNTTYCENVRIGLLRAQRDCLTNRSGTDRPAWCP